ncbi:hypothetical protein OG930_39290 [Streptomyces sp. NBC_01799]|uniref:hypothetical protein n=1 Tax=Streptomyces sp. NBC_01800 TaxID=2975945 RepID=UPI002DDB0635|nr:hypothetical protein [Streptomyces sp. NBC_01800]WSA72579.1 hypothetical protein OIE65_39900 [Streptomyces sp. NBC_01800]WSA81104.1 hypothetical protein OG930_39290 [Streptomyces sp. NBC_01799]
MTAEVDGRVGALAKVTWKLADRQTDIMRQDVDLGWGVLQGDRGGDDRPYGKGPF